MVYIFDVFILIAAVSLFGFTHTFFASIKAKEYIRQNYPTLLPFYRVTYNVISLLLLYLFFIYLPQPDITIYDLIKPFDFIILAFQFLSLAGLVWSFKYFSFGEFTGFAQIFRWFNKNYNDNDLDEKMTLKIEGPYRFMRHPVYFFSILFLIFRPYMDLTYLTIVVCFIAYFYIGSYYEEKKLATIFGEEYKSYQKAVPRIFPLKPFRPYNV
jgi:methanethiol S-methyltransferase